MLSLRLDLEAVRQWLFANRLTLNTAKTKYMLFRTRQKLSKIANSTLRIGAEEIERVPVFKYLGCWLDEVLNFEYHTDKVYSKSCSKVGVIRKVRHCLTQKLALTLYKSLVLPHIDYCDVVYMSATKESLNKLQLVQNKGCRAILGAAARDHIDEMHRDLRLLKLEDRRNLHLGLLCHKNVYPEGEQGLEKYFVKANNIGVSRVTRTNTMANVKIPKINSTSGRKAIAYRGPTHWNDLPINHKMEPKFNSFKGMLCKRAYATIDNHPT